MSKTLAKKEPIYFNVTGNWYTGKMPSFYDVSKLESTRILEGNYAEIKKEVLEFFETHSDVIKQNYTVTNYSEAGWKNLSLYGFMMKHPHHIKYFPKLGKIIEEIPHLITAQIAVLEPRTRVKAHFGDTNALIRSHLGLVVPGAYPDLGFRNKSEEYCWEEGKVLAICIAHRHYVWNNTDKKRIVLIVDTIHPDYVRYKYLIGSGLLAAATMKLFTKRFPITRKVPHLAAEFIHKSFMVPILILLILQNKFNISFTQYLNKIKK